MGERGHGMTFNRIKWKAPGKPVKHTANRSAKSLSQANRGKYLEALVDATNRKYKHARIADIRKVPTPVTIVEDHGATVTGRKEKAEWVDYVGVFRGQSVAFDAKETKIKNFPLKNLHDHQYEFLQSYYLHDALVFLIVYFDCVKKIYRLPFPILQEAWEKRLNGGPKSIPLATFEKYAEEVKSPDGYAVHYLLPYITRGDKN